MKYILLVLLCITTILPLNVFAAEPFGSIKIRNLTVVPLGDPGLSALYIQPIRGGAPCAYFWVLIESPSYETIRTIALSALYAGQSVNVVSYPNRNPPAGAGAFCELSNFGIDSKI